MSLYPNAKQDRILIVASESTARKGNSCHRVVKNHSIQNCPGQAQFITPDSRLDQFSSCLGSDLPSGVHQVYFITNELGSQKGSAWSENFAR